MVNLTRNPNLTSIVDMAIQSLPSKIRIGRRRVVEEGSAHVLVLVEEQAAVRIGRDKFVGERMRRRQELVDNIPLDFGLPLPRSLGPVVEIDGLSAVATEFIAGGPCPVGEGSPDELKRLLDMLVSVDTKPLQDLLAEPLSFCGGASWYQIQIEEVFPRLDPRVRDLARPAVDD